MPYCSIEEAWGSTFNTKKNKQETNYSNIVPDNANNNLNEYSDIDFDNDNVYTNTGEPVLATPKEKKKKRRKSFSRTMNRLPHTSGPSNRYVQGNNYKQLKFSENSKTKIPPTKLLKNQRNPSYSNLDTPISSYNKDLEQELYNSQNISNLSIGEHEDEHEDSELETSVNIEATHGYRDEEGETDEYYDEELNNKQVNLKGRHIRPRYYQSEEEERESYKDLDINELEAKRANKMRDNMFDIIVYIITGIFLIFILDLFVRLGKNSK